MPSQVSSLDQARFSDWPERTMPSRRRAKSLFRRLKDLQRRLARAVAREGATAFALRQGTRVFDRLTERARIRWRGLRPWIADSRPVYLLINHHCGGGTEQHVRGLSFELRGAGVRVVVVRPSRPGFLVWEERDENNRVAWCRESTAEPGPMKRLLEWLEPVHAHVHHVIGVPIELIDLLYERGVPFDWTIHDYHTICPRVNLINDEHSYCGEPDEAGCNQCLARLGDDQGRPVATSIESWRAGFGRRLGRARRVFVASADSRDRLERYFPDLCVLLRPHPESLPDLKSLAAAACTGRAGASCGRRHDYRGQGCRKAARVCSRRTRPLAASRISCDRVDRPRRGFLQPGQRPCLRALSSTRGLRANRRGALPSCFLAVGLSRIFHVHAFDRDGLGPIHGLFRPGGPGQPFAGLGMGSGFGP